MVLLCILAPAEIQGILGDRSGTSVVAPKSYHRRRQSIKFISLGSVRAHEAHGYLQSQINSVRRSGWSTGATDMRCGAGFCWGRADLCCVDLRPGISDAVATPLSHSVSFAGLTLDIKIGAALLSHRVRPITFYTSHIERTRSNIALRKK